MTTKQTETPAADDASEQPSSNRSTGGWTSGVDMPLTVVGVAILVLFVLVSVLFSDQVRIAGAHIYSWIAQNFGWVYVLSTAFFVFFILFLAISPVGRVRLGAPDDRPEYSTFSWIAMMFALGVGIGLIFYGAAEPVMLYQEPPPGGPEPRTPEAGVVAMEYSIFHWALHPWAFFGVAGLAFAYTTHRKGRSNLATSTLKPLLGRHADGGVGRGINTWVVVTTLVGNSVTLGLGTLQIMAGLEYVAGLPTSTWLLLLVVGILSIAFLLSATAGVGKGIKRLADFNVLLAVALMLFLLLLGPIGFIADLGSEALGGYVFNFIPMAFETAAFAESTWMENWTVFFWAWGISWAPYVGSFLAKISKGRTIREYVLGVLVAPSAATVLWFAVLGGAALHLQRSGTDIASAASRSPQAALFEVLEQYPLTIVTSIAVVVLAAVFFVSGADAGAIVLGTFSSWGEEEPHTWLVLLWGAMIGGVSVVLLVIGGLDALQWGAIVVASPFVLVLLAMCIATLKDLYSDGLLGRSKKIEASARHAAAGADRQEAAPTSR